MAQTGGAESQPAQQDDDGAGEEADDEADPEGARHQGRRCLRPEDQARREDLPAPQRPEGHRPGRHGHAALARPHRPAAEQRPRRRAGADPGRRQGDPRPARPVRVRREPRRRVARRSLLRQVPVLDRRRGKRWAAPAAPRRPTRPRRTRSPTSSTSSAARPLGRPAPRSWTSKTLRRFRRRRIGPRNVAERDGAAFLRDLDVVHPVRDAADVVHQRPEVVGERPCRLGRADRLALVALLQQVEDRALDLRVAHGHRSVSGVSRIRSTFAGAPATTALASTSLVTTVLEPITQLSPIVTPRRMHAP